MLQLTATGGFQASLTQEGRILAIGGAAAGMQRGPSLAAPSGSPISELETE